MAGFTNPVSQDILEHLLKVASWTQASVVYGLLGLSTSTPDDTGAIAEWDEPSGGAYARVNIAHPTVTWSFTTGTTSVSAKNSTEVTYPQATADWGTVTYFGLVDSATTGAGTVWMWGTLTSAKLIQTGDIPKFAVDAITLSLD